MKLRAVLLLLALLLAGVPGRVSAGGIAPELEGFYWSRGGVRIFGYPISEPFTEGGALVQWFERSRLAYRDGRVWVPAVGSEYAAARKLSWGPAAPIGGENCSWFERTRHNLCWGFRWFWEHNGGEEIFGLPLSEELTEDGRTVQYFEKARFEYHPELAGTDWETSLGLLGSLLTGKGSTAVQVSPSQPLSLRLVNHYRALAGQQPLRWDDRLAAAAAAHARFVTAMLGKYRVIWGHFEPAPDRYPDRALPDLYVGDWPGDRAVAFGFPNRYVGEIMTYGMVVPAGISGEAVSISQLAAAPYHAALMTGGSSPLIGCGTGGDVRAWPGQSLVCDFGWETWRPTKAGVRVYPYPGMTLGPLSFVGETPDPRPPELRSRDVPSPVAVFGDGKLELLEAHIWGPEGEVPWVQGNTGEKRVENVLVLFPYPDRSKLPANASFRAYVKVLHEGQVVERSWEWRTGPDTGREWWRAMCVELPGDLALEAGCR